MAAAKIVEQFPEMADSCRDNFRDCIYFIYADKKKGPEVEVIKPDDLVYKLEYLVHPYVLNDDEK